MAIKRYKATADNTIVNTYKPGWQLRATGSNSGMADVIEVYSIYGRVTSGSQELSRILIKFPTATIVSDRTAKSIPASGSVSFYLRLFNAQHSKTVPRDYKLVVNPMFSDWQEGTGLDLESYKDATLGNAGSNWMERANTPGVAEIRDYTFGSDTKADYGAGSGANYVKIYNGTTRWNVWFNDGSGDSAPTADGTEVEVDISAGSDNTAAEFAERFKVAVHALSGFTATRDGAVVTVTNAALGPSTHSSIEGTISPITIDITQKGTMETPWNSVSGGGDWLSSSADYRYEQTFETGLEDLEIDITPLVERWIKGAGGGGIANYGVGVKLSSSYEALGTGSSGTDQSVQNNPLGATKSYYTKRFFARGSEYFFKRPVIEARWDSSTKDDRGDFYLSSSLATADENLNTIYLYNYVRGVLRDIPNITNGNPIFVNVYSGSLYNTYPTGTAITQVLNTPATGGWVSTGIYSCSLCIPSSSTIPDPIFDVWSSGSTQYFTGSIRPLELRGAMTVSKPVYYLNITNLKGKYRSNENARFNLYIRDKNWNPTIYTVAQTDPPSTTIHSASYRVYRTLDAYEAIPYGTGSDMCTLLSYDVSGNYFDFDMSSLEPGYTYGFKFAFYDPALDSWTEQPETFKFRVEDYEY